MLGFPVRFDVSTAIDRLFSRRTLARDMADEFDPEKFEDKYAHYFNELQRAYKNAFEQMNDRYDSELIHGIDQTVLNESEPFYEDGEFRVELPENPRERIRGAVAVDDEMFEETLDEYVERIESELYRTLGVDRPE
jgi:hypothetical protein